MAISALLWAARAGAFPLGSPAAQSTTSTGTIAYQGRLADTSGNPLTGTYTMAFRLYAALQGERPFGPNSGRAPTALRCRTAFNVMLGSLTPIPQSAVTGNNTLWLGITVGTDNEMTPRVQLGSVPFAVQALTVPDGSVTTAKIADGAVTAAKLGGSLPRLLGQKTSTGGTTESAPAGWLPMKGASSQDLIEVTESTTGGPVLVTLTGRGDTTPAVTRVCAIYVYQGTTFVERGDLDTTDTPMGQYGCSGSYTFTDLSAGTYTFEGMMLLGTSVTSIYWNTERQIVAYQF